MRRAANTLATYADRVPTPTMSSQFEMGTSQNGLPDVSSFGTRNALFTSTSRRPCSASTRSNSAATASSSRWSHCTAIPMPPRAPISRAVAPIVPGSGWSDSSSDRPVTYTVAPAAPSSSAHPLPIPRLAPVTMATEPASVGHASPSHARVRCATASGPTDRTGAPPRLHELVVGPRVGDRIRRDASRGELGERRPHPRRERVGSGECRAPAKSRQVLTSSVPNVKGRSSA